MTRIFLLIITSFLGMVVITLRIVLRQEHTRQIANFILILLPLCVQSNPLQFRLGLHEGNSIVTAFNKEYVSDAGFSGIQLGFEKHLNSLSLLAFNVDAVLTKRHPFFIDLGIDDSCYSALIFSTHYCMRIDRLQYGLGLQYSRYWHVLDFRIRQELEREPVSAVGLYFSTDFRVYRFIHLAANYCPSVYSITNTRLEYSHAAFISILLRTPKQWIGPAPAIKVE